MARRTFAEYKASVVHALGAEPATGVDKAEVVQDALQHLANIHRWTWRRGGPVMLSLTGPLSITGMTYSEPGAVPTLTKTGAFSTYTFAAGDTIEITGGTGVTAGVYRILAKSSNDAITLSDDIGTPTPTDVAGTISFPYINLPADFGEDYSATYPNSFSRQMIRTTMEHIEWLRSSPVGESFGFTYYYALNTGQSTTPAAGLDSTPRFEIYPTPQGSSVNAMQVVYLRNMRRFSADTDTPQIPPYLDYALDLLCRAKAHTLEDDDPNSAPMQEFERIIPELRARDGSSQARKGQMRGGLYPRVMGLDPLYPSNIGDPS